MDVDPELDQLERKLDAAFASARPRPAFRDELEARLQRRWRTWWQLPLVGPARWPVLGGAVALLMAATVVTLLAGPLRGGGGLGSPGPTGQPRVAAPVGTPTSGSGLMPQIKSPCESPSPSPSASASRPKKPPTVQASCR